ncbi:MAG TPA: bifunctional phosphoribosyl-AMP cyclohydrolase/phosphoribosyl-ATP diphosphatase HisIE [Gemmatimonadaceae bacterium]|nr:bifunctional phosphoribosyl-AMP cyclohydrolase/phosphoribosyl-ATP diphosphatase HisIE [Gemmatimonadaceae bacterium]
MSAPLNLDAVRFDNASGQGTVVVVTQDAATGRVLMVANADREALERTIESGEMHYRSRTRGLWRKGATSGNVQKVVSLTPDCDGDTVLARVVSAGPACHTGAVSCFDTEGVPNIWSKLAETISRRAAEPDVGTSYTRRLLRDRNLRLKKIGEESAELIAACADEDPSRAAEEAADLIYHIGVALEAVGSSLDAVAKVLVERDQRSKVDLSANSKYIAT